MKGLFPLRWRQVRWAALGAALPALWACSSRTLVAPVSAPSQTTNDTFQASVNRKIDILFMVDNSQSMAPLQDKLLANFPVFMNILKGLPGGLPDVHIAVVSSDTGPGQFDQTSGHCAFMGDHGSFQTAPRGTCTASPLNAGETFLAASNNQGTKNYTGDITDAFTCIAKLGDQGCGFEGQLKSVRWALDPNNPAGNNNNGGSTSFLRDDAFLAVILITNEDDCSVPDDSPLFDSSQRSMSDQYGPFWSFRCNEFGHLCNINGTMQPPPRGMADSPNNLQNIPGCVSNDTPSGMLTHISGTSIDPNDTNNFGEVAFLRSLKGDPSQIFVAAITGINQQTNSGRPEPYSINMVSKPVPNAASEYQPEIAHVCQLATDDQQYADPAVRITQWVQAFGDHGLEMPICADSFAPALTLIGNQLSKALGPECIYGKVVQKGGNAPPMDYVCNVADRLRTNGGTYVETPLPECVEAPGTYPCWQLANNAMHCPAMNGATGLEVVVSYDASGTTPPPDGVNHVVSCQLCTNTTDPGCQ
jgi:hypothetical protein